MSNNDGVLLNDVPVTPAPISHTDAARALIDQIRAMRQQIPNFVIPSSRNESQRLSSAATIPPQFVELTAVAVGSSSELVRGGGADAAQNRDLLSYAEAYAPFADELEALAHFVRHSTIVAKNKVGSDALTTYALAKRLAKRPGTADLAPHVADMSRALGRKGRSRKVKSQPVPASPVSTQASPVTTESPAAPSKTN